MEQKFLIVNAGSASKKYALYTGEVERFRAHLEREGLGFVGSFRTGDKEQKIDVSQEQYQSAVAYILGLLASEGLIQNNLEITVVGLRVVAPGEFFLTNKMVDGEYMNQLNVAKQEAPLHIGPIISEIEQIRGVLSDVKIVGVSDSIFHKTMSRHARLYSLPEEVASKFGVYRFGYHGISMQSIVSKLEKMNGGIPSKVIICHLGGGATISAIRDGKSFDTSMGFTPMEGLPMGTRIGDIDAGAVIFLAKKMGLELDELESFLNLNCGLLGLSGKTGDVRELLELESGGDKNAKLALDTFVYRIKKLVGSYAVAMNGLDLLVFTASIGERSYIMRSRICADMGVIGVAIDSGKNEQTVSIDGFIDDGSSTTKVAVITTDEMREISKEIAVVI